MTRDNIAANVAINLEDAGLGFFSSLDINNSIQDGYDEISAYAMQIEKTATITAVANQVYYDMAVLFTDPIAVSRVYNVLSKQWLLPSSSKLLDEIRWDWELWTGEPKMFFPHSWNKLALVPHKTVIGGTFIIYYRASADLLVGASIPQIASDEFRLLEKYATADLLIQAKEWEKAVSWFQEYNKELEEYKIDTKTLAQDDFVTRLHE